MFKYMKAFIFLLFVFFIAFQINTRLNPKERLNDEDITNIANIAEVHAIDTVYADNQTPNNDIAALDLKKHIWSTLCDSLLNIHIDKEQKVQKVETVNQTLVERKGYKYSIDFMFTKDEIIASVYSKSGVIFNQGDEFIFIDSMNVRKIFKFFQIGRKLTKTGETVFGNAIQLDSEAVKWLANSFIKTIYIKNNITNEIRKYIINKENQVAFNNISACFYNALNQSGKWGAIENTPKKEKESVPDSDDRVYQVVQEMPRFPGCENEPKDMREGCAHTKMLEFVYENLEYPPVAKENQIEGTVIIQFLIDENGLISQPKILKNIRGDCGEEAVRIVNLMNNMDEKWTPGKQGGKLVKVKYHIPIRFRLD